MHLVRRALIQTNLSLEEFVAELLEFLNARRLLVGHFVAIDLEARHNLRVIARLRLPVLRLLDEHIDSLQLVRELLILDTAFHLFISCHVFESQVEVIAEKEEENDAHDGADDTYDAKVFLLVEEKEAEVQPHGRPELLASLLIVEHESLLVLTLHLLQEYEEARDGSV